MTASSGPRRTRHGSRRLRVLTYNILLGGDRRHDLITELLERSGADVIALQEVSDVSFAQWLADHLDMALVIGEPSDGSELNVALLSRLPVLSWRNRRHPGRMLRSHLDCEIEAGVAGSRQRLRIHCLHLAARFGERANGETRRMRELSSVLEGVEEGGPVPHIIVGDFNAVAPGDAVGATIFFRKMTELRRAGLVVALPDGTVGPRRRHLVGDGLDSAWAKMGIDPRLDISVPDLPRVVGALSGPVPSNPLLDRVFGRIIDRRTVRRLLTLGYTDCYRATHPRARGFTCATWVPAARIDYAFASPALAPRMERCDIVGSRERPERVAAIASDHYPLVADFSL